MHGYPTGGGLSGWLPPAEREVLSARQHWMALVWDLLAAAPVVFVVLLLDSAVQNGRLAASALLSLPVFLAVLAATLRALVRWLTTKLTVTHRHLVLQHGVVVRLRRSIPLHQVHRVVVRRTILGWLLRYGSLDFYVLASERPERFRHAPAALLDEELFAPR